MPERPMAHLDDGMLVLIEFLAEHRLDEELKEYLLRVYGILGARINVYNNMVAVQKECGRPYGCGSCCMCEPYKDDSLLFEVVRDMEAYGEGRLDLETGLITEPEVAAEGPQEEFCF
jgi:hypothetical protein